jgi:CheY-like chemotaxis protein
MEKKDTSEASNSLVRSSSESLAQRSNSLLIRGVRDVEAMEQAETHTNASSPRPESAQVEQVLLVDDEAEIREIACSMLASSGYECRAVAGGLEALALLESGEQFELLITDVLNSPLDGLSLLEGVKKRFPDIPVVVASAVYDDSVIQSCLKAGAFAYLVHPVTTKQLADAVRAALAHRRRCLKLKNRSSVSAGSKFLETKVLNLDQFTVSYARGIAMGESGSFSELWKTGDRWTYLGVVKDTEVPKKTYGFFLIGNNDLEFWTEIGDPARLTQEKLKGAFLKYRSRLFPEDLMPGGGPLNEEWETYSSRLPLEERTLAVRKAWERATGGPGYGKEVTPPAESGADGRQPQVPVGPGTANKQYITCEDCGTEYPPGSLRLLPISDALRFDLWPDDTKMFFCQTCDTYVVMSPPHVNEE